MSISHTIYISVPFWANPKGALFNTELKGHRDGGLSTLCAKEVDVIRLHPTSKFHCPLNAAGWPMAPHRFALNDATMDDRAILAMVESGGCVHVRAGIVDIIRSSDLLKLDSRRPCDACGMRIDYAPVETSGMSSFEQPATASAS